MFGAIARVGRAVRFWWYAKQACFALAMIHRLDAWFMRAIDLSIEHPRVVRTGTGQR